MTSARKSVPIAAFPDDVQDMLRNEIDLDHSGGIGEADLKAMVAAYKKQKQKVSFLKWIIVGGGFALILMSGATFAVSLAAAELAKDSTPSADGVSILKSTGLPSVTSEFTLSGGISRVNGSRRLQSRRLQRDEIDSSDEIDGSDEIDDISQFYEYHLLDIARPQAMRACEVFKQGAASKMYAEVDGRMTHISVTSVLDGCQSGYGTSASGAWSWSVHCPDGADVCHAFTPVLPDTESDGDTEERRLAELKGIGVLGVFGPMPAFVWHITAPDPVTVICTQMRKVGRLSQGEWESSRMAGKQMPALVYQGYRYWADVMLENLKTVEGTTNVQLEIIAEFFVKAYARQLGWFQQRSWGEFSLIGVGLMLVGYPLCFIMGSLNVALPSLMGHFQVGTALTIQHMAALIYHTNQMKGAFMLAGLLVGMHARKTLCRS